MDLILQDSQTTFSAEAKTITLGAPYTSLSESQILKIVNLTTYETLYDANVLGFPISMAAAVITHTYDNSYHADTDLLQVTIDIGGSSAVPITVNIGANNAMAYETITVADIAIGPTTLTYGAATKAELTLETAQVRVRKDGTDPTSSEGHLVEVGDIIVLNSAADLETFKAIRTGTTSGVFKVSYSV